MKTILNYQPLRLQGLKGFLNVETKEEVKTFKKKLEQYHYLHRLGVKISKANKKFVFATLNKLQESEDALIKLIQEGGTDETKDNLKEIIAEHKALLIELSEIQDEIIAGELPAPRPNLQTMIMFEKIIPRESLPTLYVTKRNRKFTVRNERRFAIHQAFVAECVEKINKRKAEEKKALKAEVRKAEKQNTFVEKVFEKKNLNK